LKLFDYMGLGIPVLGSDFAELRRIIMDLCGCGAMTNPGDPEAIRRAVETLLRDVGRRQEMGRRARECFQTRFCQERQEEALQRSHPVFAAGADRQG